MAEEVSAKFNKFCSKTVLEHEVEELKHVSRSDHASRMVAVLRDAMSKLKEGMRVIFLLSTERKEMIAAI